MVHYFDRSVGKLWFAPGQHENHMLLVLTDTLDELHKVSTEFSCDEDTDSEACCCFQHGVKGPYHGLIVLSMENITRSLLVHEVAHAGALFVNEHVMTSKEVQEMTQDEQLDYYHEVVARCIEALYAQAEAILWPIRKAVETNLP